MLVSQLLNMRVVDIARYMDNELPRIEDGVENEVTDVLGDSEPELRAIVVSLEDNMVEYVPPFAIAGLSVVSFFADLNAAFVDAVRPVAAPELMLQLGAFLEQQIEDADLVAEIYDVHSRRNV